MATVKQLGLTRGSLVKRVATHEFQFELFRLAHLETTCAERSVFILRDEALAAVGRGEDIALDDLHNYKLTSRERPIKIFDTGSGCNCINGTSRYSYAKNACGLGEMTEDETKLFLTGQMAGSVEFHETTAFAGAF